MDKRQGIIQASQGLFARFGLRKVTTDDIAKAARVSKATIYKHYRNKREILKDVVAYESAELLKKIRDAVAQKRTVEEKLQAHLLVKITTIHQLVNLHRVTEETMTDLWEQAPKLRDQFVKAEIEIVADILKSGVDRENMDIPDVLMTARLLVFSLKALEYPWVFQNMDLSIKEQVDLMLQLLLNGIRSRN